MKKLLLFILLAVSILTKGQVPTHKEVYIEIVKSGILYPEIVYAQSVLESGAFRSKLAKYNKNLFGMRMPKYRETLATGKKRGYATYKSWQASIKDYKLWQDYLFRKGIMTARQFKNYLNLRYSETDKYVAKLNLIIKVNKIKYEEEL